jgi:hypothetical protein
MKKYLIKFNFTTVKVNPNGSISGSNGSAECNISSIYPLEELRTKTGDLKLIAYNSLVTIKKVKKMGTIQSIDIVEVLAIN